MTTFHVYKPTGELLLESDLDALSATRAVVFSVADHLSLASSVPAAAAVLAALVKDEDGWTLAAATQTDEISDGSRAAPDVHLVPGVTYRLAGLLFRVERSSSSSPYTILWRLRSVRTVRADAVLDGRNAVGTRPGGTDPEVNPAVAGSVLLEFVVTPAGLEVTTAAAQKPLAVPFGALFAVGPFEGLVLPAADAAAALKTSQPLAWPGRRVRRHVLAAAAVVAVVVLAAAYVSLDAREAAAELARPRGAVETASATNAEITVAASADDLLVYNMHFLRTLPGILGAVPVPMENFLTDRGVLLAHDPSVAAKVAFVRDVRAIQLAIQARDWARLRNLLAVADASEFTFFDGDGFLADARELSRFVSETLPAFFSEASRVGSDKFSAAGDAVADAFASLADNRFMTGAVAREERESAGKRFRVLGAYVAVRDAFLAGTGSVTAVSAAYTGVEQAFAAASGPVSSNLVARERATLAAGVTKAAATVASGHEEVLADLAAFGERLGIDRTLTVAWRARGTAAAAALDAKFRELYAAYRLAAADDGATRADILRRMLALGPSSNRFYSWALREKARLQSSAEIKK